MSMDKPTSRPAERAAAARRRTVLYVLTGLTLLSAMLSIVGFLPWWSFLLPLLLIAGFLVVARLSVRAARQPLWVDVADAAQASAAAPSGEAASPDAAPASETKDDDEPTVGLTAAMREAAAPQRIANGSTLWDPLPVTLPTYVDAPVARRAFRTIAIGAEASPPPAASPVTAAPVADPAVDDVPRAVNG